MIIDEIKAKFGRVSRFAIIAGIPYQQIIDAVRNDREWKIKEIRAKLEACEDRALEGEITPELRQKIAKGWAKCDQKAIKKEFNYYWIHSLINSTRRMFITPKVNRLIKKLYE